MAFVRRGNLQGLGEGDEFSVETCLGDVWDGTVVVQHPPHEVALVIDSLDRGILRVDTSPGCGIVALHLWGEEAAGRVRAFEEKWRNRVGELVGAP